jgi:hypothetical protein
MKEHNSHLLTQIGIFERHSTFQQLSIAKTVIHFRPNRWLTNGQISSPRRGESLAQIPATSVLPESS